MQFCIPFVANEWYFGAKEWVSRLTCSRLGLTTSPGKRPVE